jgi:hypothetical protein
VPVHFPGSQSSHYNLSPGSKHSIEVANFNLNDGPLKLFQDTCRIDVLLSITKSCLLRLSTKYSGEWYSDLLV